MGFTTMSLDDAGSYEVVSTKADDPMFAHEINAAGGRGGFGGPPEDSGMAVLSDPFTIEDCAFGDGGPISLTIKSNVSDFVDTWTMNEVAGGVYTDTDDSLSMELLTKPTKDNSVAEVVDVRVVSTTFGIIRKMRLYETAMDSNVFTSRRVQIVLAVTSPLSDQVADQIFVTVSTSLSSTPQSDQLVETGPNTGIFRNLDGSLSLAIQDGLTQGLILKEDAIPGRAWVTALVSSTVLGIDSESVDAIEAVAGSGELRTDLLHNHGVPDRVPGALNALSIAYTAVIGKKETKDNTDHWVPDASKKGPARFRFDRKSFMSDDSKGGEQLGQPNADLKFKDGRLVYKNKTAMVVFVKAVVKQGVVPPPATIAYEDTGKITISNVVPGDKVIVDLLSDDSKSLIGSDNVRLVDVVLKVGNEVILPNKYAYIDGDAVMPRLTAALFPQVDGATVDWQLEILYKRSGRNDHDDFPAQAPKRLNSNQEWDIVPDLGTEQGATGQVPVVRGGEAILTFEFKGDAFKGVAKGSYPFRIRGTNPTIDQIRAFAVGKPWYLLAIAKSETHWVVNNTKKEQFNEAGATNSDSGAADVMGSPNAANNGDGGFGIMQLTNLTIGRGPNKLELWSWKENMSRAQKELETHRTHAQIWMNSPVVVPGLANNKGQRVQAQAEVGHVVPVPDRTVGAVTFKDGSARPIEDAVALKRFNGASQGNYCSWANAVGGAPGYWKFNVLNNLGVDYVLRVCNEAEGDGTTTP